MAHNRKELINQLLATLATGNHPIITVRDARLIKGELPPSIWNEVQVIETSEIEAADIHLALVGADEIHHYAPLLAARDGALIPLVETTEAGAIPVWRLCAEHAISVNTTAAGGNASLMAMSA